jgi:hypothetical protein
MQFCPSNTNRQQLGTVTDSSSSPSSSSSTDRRRSAAAAANPDGRPVEQPLGQAGAAAADGAGAAALRLPAHRRPHQVPPPPRPLPSPSLIPANGICAPVGSEARRAFRNAIQRRGFLNFVLLIARLD